MFECYRSRTSSVLTLYRLVVLPVANTWMSWSLLHKLHWDPNPPFLAALTLLMTLFLALGLKVSLLSRLFVLPLTLDFPGEQHWPTDILNRQNAVHIWSFMQILAHRHASPSKKTYLHMSLRLDCDHHVTPVESGLFQLPAWNFKDRRERIVYACLPVFLLFGFED